MPTFMHVTVDGVNFYDGPVSVYVKSKSHALTARELPCLYIGLCLLNMTVLQRAIRLFVQYCVIKHVCALYHLHLQK